MISSLQPTRPKYTASSSSTPSAPFTMKPPPPSPLNQQPARAFPAVSAPAVPYTPIHTTHCFPKPYQPRTQIEALPPRSLLSFNFDDFLRLDYASLGPHRGLLLPQAAQPPQYDPATRHPVFFTNTLQKPPFGVAAGNSVSPVAMGYVENSISNKKDGGNVKL